MAAGAQIIALNTQTKDYYAILMMSYFKSGRETNPANIGYVEKPIHLRADKKKEQTNLEITIDLVEVYSQKVTMKFFGLGEDMKLNEGAKSKFITKNPEESFIILIINDTLKDVIPVRFIRTGYRIVLARSEDFIDSGRRVIIHIEVGQK